MATTRDPPIQGCTPDASGSVDGTTLPTTTTTATLQDTGDGLSPVSNGTIAYTEEDQVNLMQRVRATRWFFLYTLEDTEPMAEELQGEEMEDPVRAFKHLFLSRQPHLEIDLCFVSPIPRDLRATDTTPMLYTYAGQIQTTKVLIMLDVEIYSNAVRPHRQPGDRPVPVDEWREISQVRTRVTRTQFLHELGLMHLCEGENKICILLHRDQVWPMQDATERTIRSGDYVVAKVKQTYEPDDLRVTQSCSSRDLPPESNIRCIWGPFVASGVSLLVVLMGSPSQCGVMLYLGPMVSRASKNYKMRCPAMPIETIAQHSFAMSWEAYPNNCMSCA